MEIDNKTTTQKVLYYHHLPTVLEGTVIKGQDQLPVKIIELINSMALIGQAIILCDQDCRIISYNSEAEVFLGKNKQVGEKSRILTDVFSSAAWDARGGEFFIERYMLPEGKISSLKISFNPVQLDGYGMFYIVVLNDVSDFVQARQAAQDANIAKSQFVAHISHEIRTPLLGILGFCERLGLAALEESQKESVETIESCAHQLLALVNNLLDISKIESQIVEIYKHPFKIRDLVRQVMLLIQPGLKGRDITLELDIDFALPDHFVGDEMKIRQVLSNLLVNAAKYTDTGSIKVSIYREEESLNTGDLTICISVSDTGVGVENSEMERIFEPFVQIDRLREHPGNGLGLAICKQLVEAMGGCIWCESNHPRGSRFCFKLPLKAGTLADGISEKSGDYSFPDFRSRFDSRPTIILVEDIKVNRKLIQYMLEDLGCKVMAVDNGQRCLNLLEKSVPDLILMDMQMPVLNGYETTRIIRRTKQWRHIPIIALTAYAMNGDVEKCLEVGCNYYLSKPFTSEQLYILLERCLESSFDCCDIS